jgi:Helix-turn-helix domain
MLPILVQHLPRDRERMGLREVQMAGQLGLTLAEYRTLEAEELHITNDLYERIVNLCGWPRG